MERVKGIEPSCLALAIVLTQMISLNFAVASHICSLVNRLKPFVALIVLALWATCTIRCDLLSVASSATDSCCDSAADNSPEKRAPANQCECSLALSGGFIAEKTTVLMPLLVGLPLLAPSTEVEIPKSDACVAELIFSPPELLTSWHISSRAAGSPRAPSFVS